MSLGINDIKKGSLVVLGGEPYLVMTISHQHIGRGSANAQLKTKSLMSGKIIDRTLKPSDQIEEAEISKMDAEFIYNRGLEYWFHEAGNPGNRFSIEGEVIGEQGAFLKAKMAVRAVKFGGKVINVELPVKAEYEVTEAPPNVRGNTAQGGTKQVTIETGAKITTPMFVETGDMIRVNTETGEYVERV
ncbi:MAG: elongation factor P [bacterium]|nr:elongation factor P [bacterium]